MAQIPSRALLARCRGFHQPTTGKEVYSECELPADFQAVRAKWDSYTASGSIEAEEE